jgi:hypothetical protein
MNLSDLFQFFGGDADTIRRLAADPWTLAVGALLVLSAGLARHYDAHDLRRQWWRLLVPFAASTLAATGLSLVVLLITPAGTAALLLGRGLLGLFWLTAPLAWLYGLPFERLWQPRQAARARRITLGVVAACRVALLARCVSVLLGYAWWAGLLVVACFAAPAALLAVAVVLVVRGRQETRRPSSRTKTDDRAGDAVTGAAEEVMDFMGVVPRSAVPPPGLPRLEADVDAAAGAPLGCLAVVLLVLLPLLLLRIVGPPTSALPDLQAASLNPPAPAVWVAAGLALLYWVSWLVLRQPAQQRCSEFTQRLRFGNLEKTVQDLAALGPANFPPHWNPGAALARWDFASRMLDATQLAADLPVGSWVWAGFLERFRGMLPVWLDPPNLWLAEGRRMSPDQLRELTRVRELLCRLPEGRAIVEPYWDYLNELCDAVRKRDPSHWEILQDLLALSLKRGSKR